MAQFQSILTSDPGPRFEACVAEAHAILQKAADQWALGHPEDPPTREVLELVIRVFEREHFLRRGLGKI